MIHLMTLRIIFFFRFIDEVLDAYAPKILLIAHDEITGLSLYAERYHMNTGDILAADVNRIRDWLAQRGVRTAMWWMPLDKELRR